MKVKSLLYVDNCATSVNSVVELNTLREESQKILKKAKFDLWGRKNNFLPEIGKTVTDVLGITEKEAFSHPEDKCLVSLQAIVVYRNKSKQDLQKRFKVEYLGLILLLLLNDSTFTNNFPFSDSPETVCLPDSDAAVSITPIIPVDVAMVRIPDENGSPVHVGGAINGQDEITLDVSPLTIPDDPEPAFPLTIPDDPVPAFPLTIPDDPEPEVGDHSYPSPIKEL
ncbi:hypothetical protein TNCT_27251 [Trichonephila clavata]|uniref:Uncharacterized protein n=1 Tax=Trichonephila clavata TaxID=2740835 RepID=A0A8X6JVV9_TRICU|nr:hypothetical protein TNCT_27251 [Trichonephila clavata]